LNAAQLGVAAAVRGGNARAQDYTDPVLETYVVLMGTSCIFSLTCVITLTILGLQIDLCINKASTGRMASLYVLSGCVLTRLLRPSRPGAPSCHPAQQMPVVGPNPRLPCNQHATGA
jgi:hypothetical protein